jgi:cysteinyl-tRNA synthetase
MSLLCMQEDELALSAAVQEAQVKVHEALIDNINTAAALDALSGLIKATNLYLAGKQAAAAAADGACESGLLPAGPQPLLLRKAAAFMTRILSVMGVLPVSDGWSRCLCDGDSPAS